MLTWLLATAIAYETDQLTWRDRPLAPADKLANAELNRLLDIAATNTNEALSCSADQATTQHRLAKEIREVTSPRTRIEGRKLWRQFGFGLYTGWLEMSEAERRDFPDRQDIYGGLTMLQSVILTRSGPASTFYVGGQLVGSDKLDHFLDTGFVYYEWSHAGKKREVALRRGTLTERSLYGIATSKTFSWADLAANADGLDFYAGLLEDSSVLQLDSEGCVTRVRDFRWTEHANWRWDEVLNPSVHSRMVGRAVQRRLRRRREQYCAEWRVWGGGDYTAHLAEVLATPSPDARGVAPPRADPYDLAGLCTEGATWAPDAGVPRFWRGKAQKAINAEREPREPR